MSDNGLRVRSVMSDTDLPSYAMSGTSLRAVRYGPRLYCCAARLNASGTKCTEKGFDSAGPRTWTRAMCPCQPRNSSARY
eukprot:3870489-Rhodomonas_salina.2